MLTEIILEPGLTRVTDCWLPPRLTSAMYPVYTRRNRTFNPQTLLICVTLDEDRPSIKEEGDFLFLHKQRRMIYQERHITTGVKQNRWDPSEKYMSTPKGQCHMGPYYNIACHGGHTLGGVFNVSAGWSYIWPAMMTYFHGLVVVVVVGLIDLTSCTNTNLANLRHNFGCPITSSSLAPWTPLVGVPMGWSNMSTTNTIVQLSFWATIYQPLSS